MVKMNRMDPAIPFLSNKVKGTVTAEVPDGCNYSENLAPWEAGSSPLQDGSDIPEKRDYGARTGRGKKTSVV